MHFLGADADMLNGRAILAAVRWPRLAQQNLHFKGRGRNPHMGWRRPPAQILHFRLGVIYVSPSPCYAKLVCGFSGIFCLARLRVPTPTLHKGGGGTGASKSEVKILSLLGFRQQTCGTKSVALCNVMFGKRAETSAVSFTLYVYTGTGDTHRSISAWAQV